MIRSIITAGVKVPRRADWPAAFSALRGRLRGSITPSAVSTLADAIQTHEGYYPGSVAYNNNNPGNLVFAGQPGATLGAGGFAKFQTYAQGRAAEENQITLDATRGTDVNGNPVETVGQLINSWAPASAGNDTGAYIASVTSQTGYGADAPLWSLDAGGSFDSAGLVPDFTSGDGAAAVSPAVWIAAVAAAGLLLFRRN